LFLTQDQLQELTGYRKATKQIQWLCRNAVPHFVNRQGKPVVPKDLMNARTVTEKRLGDVR
jgi:hypothetical protein